MRASELRLLGPEGVGAWESARGVPPGRSAELKVKTLWSRGKQLARLFSILPKTRQPQICSSWGGELGGVLQCRQGAMAQLDGAREETEPCRGLGCEQPRSENRYLAWDLGGMWTGKIQVSFPAM